MGEAICRGEAFNQRRFDEYSNWSDGKPIPTEKLWPGYLQHTDRDKVYLVAERILVLQPGCSTGVDEHCARLGPRRKCCCEHQEFGLPQSEWPRRYSFHPTPCSTKTRLRKSLVTTYRTCTV